MQFEGTELIFIMNFSALGFFKFASRMPEIAQILVSTPPRNFLFFFFFSNSRVCTVKYTFGGKSTRQSIAAQQAQPCSRIATSEAVATDPDGFSSKCRNIKFVLHLVAVCGSF